MGRLIYLRRAGAGPAAPPGPVRAGRRQFRGFLENSEIFSGIFLKIWEYFLKKSNFSEKKPSARRSRASCAAGACAGGKVTITGETGSVGRKIPKIFRDFKKIRVCFDIWCWNSLCGVRKWCKRDFKLTLTLYLHV